MGYTDYIVKCNVDPEQSIMDVCLFEILSNAERERGLQGSPSLPTVRRGAFAVLGFAILAFSSDGTGIATEASHAETG